MAVDAARFRQVLGHFATGVAVVTISYQNTLYGITINSFTSLSLEPALILVCVDKRVTTHDILAQTDGFVVNILDKNQEHLSRKFASPAAEKFRGVAWHAGQLAHPVLEGSLAVIECRSYNQFDGGDHTIFVGEVIDAAVNEGQPLVYYRGGYCELA